MLLAREDFTFPALGVDSFHAAHAGKWGAFGGFRSMRSRPPGTRQSERK
jgi:hypothetical protein